MKSLKKNITLPDAENNTFNFRIEDVPREVMEAWAYESLWRDYNIAVGMTTINRYEEIKNKYPTWFKNK